MVNSDDTDHYEGALLEEVRDMFRAIQEGQDAMADVPIRLNSIDNRLDSIESELTTIKLVLTDHSGQIDNHEVRIVKLEGSTP